MASYEDVLFILMKRLDLIILNLCFLPTYIWYARRIWTGGEEAVSAFLIPVCLFVVWRLRPKVKEKLDYIILGAVGLYTILWVIGAPAMIKAGIAIVALLHYTGCLRHFGVTALAFLSLPWLSSFQYFLGYPLRKVVAEGSSLILNLVSVPVHAEGTGIAFQGSQVFVDPPCSGVRMIWAILFLSAILCSLFKSSWRQGITTCICAMVLAILGNIIRAAILFFPESKLVHWPDWTHETVGIAAYIGVCTALFLSFRFMNYEPKKTNTYYVNP